MAKGEFVMYNRRLFFFIVMTVNYCSGMDTGLSWIPQKIAAEPSVQQIILLNGTTTAGKTSIALQFKDLLEAKSLPVEVLAIDDFMIPKVQWRLAANWV